MVTFYFSWVSEVTIFLMYHVRVSKKDGMMEGALPLLLFL